MADPRVIQNIKRAAAQTGADPAALLATSLTEDGARPGVVGDNGTSFGPFQFHVGGALGSHAPAWADSYPAFLNRAQEFQRLQVHGGKGAAAVQRPADPSGYALKVQGNLAEARRLLGNAAPPAGPVSQPQRSAIQTADHADIGSSLIQSILDSNAKLAGISSIQLPVAPTVTHPVAPSAATATPQQQAAKTLLPTGRVVSVKNPKLIGLPYQGTHKLYGNWESDNAIDIALPRMTPVYATSNGVIGSQIGSLNSSDPHMAGERLHLKVAGNELYYQHLSKIVVQAGQRVKKGQLLGYTGALNHLHLGVQKGDPRRYA